MGSIREQMEEEQMPPQVMVTFQHGGSSSRGGWTNSSKGWERESCPSFFPSPFSWELAKTFPQPFWQNLAGS